MQKTYYTIDESLARQAHYANSQRTFAQGKLTTEYCAEVDHAWELAEKSFAKYEDEKAYYLADKFAKNYAKWLNDYSRIEAMYPSILVCGGSNFNTRKKAKQNSYRNSHKKKYDDIKGILRRIETLGTSGIQSNDAKAVEKLQKKLERLEALQEFMKKANAYYKKHGTIDGFDCSEADLAAIKEEIAFKTSCWGSCDKPYGSYQLSNNNAKIRATKQRIAELSAMKATDSTTESASVNGEPCEIVRNTEEARLQLMFDGKPADETRAILKKNGFRWSPKNSAWQRQLTRNAESTLTHYVLDNVS